MGKKTDMIDDVLYSGMMQGVRTIIKESMNKGDLNEIRTDENSGKIDGIKIIHLRAAHFVHTPDLK